MAENSGIGWTDNTMNFWQGCNKVSAECTHCYINGVMRRGGREPFNGPMRTGQQLWRKPQLLPGPHRTGQQLWRKPAKWNRQAAKSGHRLRVFTCSLTDFFHEVADPWRPEAWQIIRDCQNLDWQVLTKRPELVRDRLPDDWGDGYPNVWLGVTCGVENSLHRVELLRSLPAALRWVSAEPLLGPIDFRSHLDGSIQWIITGCEQAGKNKRRPMDMDWVRDIDEQCRDAGIAHFFKQRYEGTRITQDGLLDGKVRQEWPNSVIVQRQ